MSQGHPRAICGTSQKHVSFSWDILRCPRDVLEVVPGLLEWPTCVSTPAVPGHCLLVLGHCLLVPGHCPLVPRHCPLVPRHCPLSWGIAPCPRAFPTVLGQCPLVLSAFPFAHLHVPSPICPSSLALCF